MEFKDIIEKLKYIDDICDNAKYSLDTAKDLDILSNELKRHARIIRECCY